MDERVLAAVDTSLEGGEDGAPDVLDKEELQEKTLCLKDACYGKGAEMLEPGTTGLFTLLAGCRRQTAPFMG